MSKPPPLRHVGWDYLVASGVCRIRDHEIKRDQFPSGLVFLQGI